MMCSMHDTPQLHCTLHSSNGGLYFGREVASPLGGHRHASGARGRLCSDVIGRGGARQGEKHSLMIRGLKITDGFPKANDEKNAADPSNSVYGMIRLPQVAQHAQLHAPVVLCEDRARWIERLWVGGVAESHVEPGRGVGRREVGDLGTGGR